MKIRSVGIFEDELKALLSNPHTSTNMKNAVSMAKQILELKKNSNFFPVKITLSTAKYSKTAVTTRIFWHLIS